MAEASMMDRLHQFAQETFVARGQGPHYVEIAHAFSLKPEQGKKLLHELLGTGIPAWVFPGTDYIASFAPFNNLPTQYRVTVEGKQNWFAQ